MKQRRVQTQAGAKKYGQPIGSLITKDRVVQIPNLYHVFGYADGGGKERALVEGGSRWGHGGVYFQRTRSKGAKKFAGPFKIYSVEDETNGSADIWGGKTDDKQFLAVLHSAAKSIGKPLSKLAYRSGASWEDRDELMKRVADALKAQGIDGIEVGGEVVVWNYSLIGKADLGAGTVMKLDAFLGYLEDADPELHDVIDKASRVRTAAGAKKYGQPIGSIIVPDVIPTTNPRKAWESIQTDEALTLFDRKAAHPERYNPSGQRGYGLKDGEVETRTVREPKKPPRIRDYVTAPTVGLSQYMDPADVEGTLGLGTSGYGKALVPTGPARPPQHVYRVMAVGEFDQAKERGYIKSDERMNLTGDEGTVASLYTTGEFYKPTDGSPFRIVRIRYDDADGWYTDDDSYIKTQERVPFDRVDAYTDPIGGEQLNKADGYTPPEGVRENAKRALEWIAEGKAGKGFTDVGRKRASDLARGASVSAETIGRMANYFSRHEVDKKATGFNSGEEGFPSPGRVAWDAWGGDAGSSWSKKIMNSMSKSDKDVLDFVEYTAKVDPVLHSVLKAGLRRVSSLAGVRRYKLPMNSIIGQTQKPMERAFSPDADPGTVKESVYRAVDRGLWQDRKAMLLDPDGGASISYLTGMPPDAAKGGAMCSRDSARTRVYTAVAWQKDGRRLLAEFIKNNADYWEEDGVYVGAWVTKFKDDKGREIPQIWLDPSRFFPTKAEAATYGAAIGELDIFALDTFDSIPVGEVEGAVLKAEGDGASVDVFIANPRDPMFSEPDLFSAINAAVNRNSSIAKLRRVRTPAGVKRFKQPMHSIILRDGQKALPWIKLHDSNGTDDYGIEHFDGMDGNAYGLIQAGDLEDWDDVPDGTIESDYIALYFPNGHGDPADYEVINDKRLPGETSAVSWLNQDIGETVRAKDLDNVRWVPGGYRRPTAKESKSVKDGGGIRRLGNTNAKGEPAPLAVPPQWTNVVVSTDPDASVWVYGFDSIGREQTIRNPRATASAGTKKYAHAKRSAKKYVAGMDAAVSREWKDDEAAAVTMLMLRYAMRIGGEGGETVKGHEALGARTLQAKNVTINQNSVTLSFVGKSAQDVKLPPIKDPEVIAMLKHYKEGKRGNDRMFPNASLSTVNRFVKDHSEGTMSPKDLRTIKGTALAVAAIKKVGPRSKPKTKNDYVKRRNEIADAVAAALGNTRTMALNSYIAPEVWAMLVGPNGDWIGPKGY